MKKRDGIRRPVLIESIREALIKSPRAIGERFCSKLRFGKRRNTLCISSFSNRKVGTKDSLCADGYLFRVSLVKSRFIELFGRVTASRDRL